MLSDAMERALNEQIRNELASAYIYLGMVAYFEAGNLPGMAKWMRFQAREEVDHAMRLFDFVTDRGGKVVLEALDAPRCGYDSPLGAFRAALEHERKVTGMIHRLYERALEENDYPAQVMLHWFIDEQVEEEKSLGEIVARMEMAGEEGASLLLLDRELAARESAD